MAGLSCGIVGLPNIGKSTLFNALTKQMIAANNFPFCTIDPNVGIVDVPDERLAILADISKTQKIIPATVTFVDIAGLVKGASKGEGLGNKFLANIRDVDLIVHLVRCFEDDNIIHVDGHIDPLSDIETIKLELVLADMQTVEKIITKLEKRAKGQKEQSLEILTLKKLSEHLQQGLWARTLELTKEEKESIKPYPFLTMKPTIYLANVAEGELPGDENPHVQKVKQLAESEGSDVIVLSCKLEEELAGLSEEEAAEYLSSLGLKEKGLDRLIKTAFHQLGLATFYTTGEKETRAWTVPRGATAPEAAGKIHSDLQRGFIRAEVISFDDFVSCGGRTKAKESGKARIEGKNYIVQGDDVILFYHN